MFGYIKPSKPDLTVREYELYRAVYCGVCRSMKACTGCVSCLSLCYDYVFLAMIRCALTKNTPSLARGRCPSHPIKKKAYAVRDEYLDFAARTAAVLTLGKTKDNADDEKGIKRAAAKVLTPFAKYAAGRADLPKLTAEVQSELECLSRLEGEGCSEIDRVADCFGRLLGDVACFGLEGDTKRIAFEVGRLTGRFIYVCDAADDLEDDAKSGRYNPLLASSDNQSVPLSADVANGLMTAARLDIMRLEGTVGLIDFSSCPLYGRIVHNIVTLGMPAELERVLGLCGHNDERMI